MLEETINNNNSNPISALPIINNVFLRNVMASGKDLIFGSAKLKAILALSQPGIAPVTLKSLPYFHYFHL